MGKKRICCGNANIGAVMMYYLISLFSVIIFLSIIIIGNQINKRLLQICNSIDGTNQRLDRVIPKIEQLFRQYGFEERDGGN
jgi:hypothetical protein